MLSFYKKTHDIIGMDSKEFIDKLARARLYTRIYICLIICNNCIIIFK